MKTIGEAAREEMSMMKAKEQATKILITRHCSEYEAILKKRVEICMKEWDSPNLNKTNEEGKA